MEIAEDAEEDSRGKRQSTVPEERPPTAKAPSVSGTQAAQVSSPPPPPPTGVPISSTYSSMVVEAELLASPARETRGSAILSRSPVINEPRKSSQSTRPDLYSSSSYGSNGKPKVKLGPRPSLDVGRPHTSSASSFYRPVSTLPAGLKLFSRGSKKGKDRPKSTFQTEPPSMTLSPPPIPHSLGTSQTPARPHTSGGRPSTSSNTPSKPLMSPTISAPKTPLITPEKARLMRALELRKKQMSATPSKELNLPSEGLSSPSVESHRSSSGAPKDVHNTLAMLDDMTKGDDSGIAFDASSTMKTDESDATRPDSYPVSPVGPSERAESTRASSISESTDETIQEANHVKRSPANEPSSDKIAPEDAPEAAPATFLSHNSKNDITTTTENKDPVLESPVQELPQLQPVTYNPVQMSPRAAEAQHPAIEEVPVVEEKAEDEGLLKDVEAVSVSQRIEATNITAPEPEISVLLPKQLSPPVVEKAEAILSLEVVPEPTSPKKEWKVPRSKFSVQDLKAEQKVPEIPTEQIPRSKFSVQDLKAEATVPELTKEPLLSTNNANATLAPKSPVGSTFSDDTKRSLTEDDRENSDISKRKKRRGLIEPIRTDIEMTDRSGANSDANLSSDDEFMNELQSAVFQDAKPISVSKSPISPVFPSPSKQRKGPNGEPNRFARAFSSPVKKEKSDSPLLEPPVPVQPEQKVPSRSVSASAAYLNRISQQQAKPMAKKANLGSGISQRIKALEKLSSLGPGTTPAPGTTGPPPGTSPAFFSVRKGSVRGASRSPSIAERADSLTRNTPSPSISRDSSPETFKVRERSGSIQDRLSAFTSSPVPTSLPPRSRPESISVTARIIRDPAQPFPAKSEAGKNPSEYAPLDLKQSPLVIDHQKAVVEPPPEKETIQQRRLSKERRLSNASRTTNSTAKERRSSITIIKDLINDTRTSFSERRKSINLEVAPVTSPPIRSPSRPPSVHVSPSNHRPMSISSRISTSSSRDNISNAVSPPPTAGSASSNGEDKPDKKSSRATRMLRRMSSSLSSSRKNIAHAMSPTVREETEPVNDARSLTSSHPSNSSITSSSINIGDVNVQFPDTLLWKRRSMLLDSQGYLILSPALTAHSNGKDRSNGGATRRFHLSEFRTPAIPDVEMQELPNSVVLDFVEGGGLQIACEDRAGQGRVLKGISQSLPQIISN
jgi:hypothetical protein